MKTTISRDEVVRLFEENPGYFYRTIKREHPEFWSSLESQYGKPVAGLYCYVYGDSSKSCRTCGSDTAFKTFRDGFFEYCSSSCAAQNAEVKQKKKQTQHDRYGGGVLNDPAIRERFQATMLERYGAEHAFQSSVLRSRYEETMIERYGTLYTEDMKSKKEATCKTRFGTEHPSQCEDFKQRVAETNLKRYGIDYPLRHAENQKRSVKARRQAYICRFDDMCADKKVTPLFDPEEYTTVFEKHPFRCLVCSHEFHDTMEPGHMKCPECAHRGSIGERELRDFLQTIYEHRMLFGDRTVIAPRELDVYIPNLQLAIEYDGLYWHNERNVGRAYHLEKTQACAKKGVRLIHIFENEWLAKRPIVESRLRNALGMSTRIGARKCRVVELSSTAASTFMSHNHIQGSCPAKVAFGLMLGDDLVAAMTFGKARFSDADWELLRYANVLNSTVQGGAQRLFNRFLVTHHPKSIVTYSDKRWNTGNLYTHLGFSYSHSSSPNYFYTRDGINLESRLKYQKHKLSAILEEFDPQLTEPQNMLINGYNRIFDCGNDVFLWNG